MFLFSVNNLHCKFYNYHGNLATMHDFNYFWSQKGSELNENLLINKWIEWKRRPQTEWKVENECRIINMSLG